MASRKGRKMMLKIRDRTHLRVLEEKIWKTLNYFRHCPLIYVSRVHNGRSDFLARQTIKNKNLICMEIGPKLKYNTSEMGFPIFFKK